MRRDVCVRVCVCVLSTDLDAVLALADPRLDPRAQCCESVHRNSFVQLHLSEFSSTQTLGIPEEGDHIWIEVRVHVSER